MDDKTQISQFLDTTGKLTAYPRKLKAKIAVLRYLAEKFEPDCIYSEKQVNEICDNWHTFSDYYLLRRELVDFGFLDRKRDNSQYWRVPDNSIDNGKQTGCV
ncbi:MAG: DUF2087 domain-containing protein [Oscillospiraceae bacterium]|nr:DUF2087 domain-containing protein [Oscillospiraceae bacterium]